MYTYTVSLIYFPVLFLPTKLNVTTKGLCGKVWLLCLIVTKTVFSVFGAERQTLCCRLGPRIIEHIQTLMGDQGDVEKETARLMMEQLCCRLDLHQRLLLLEKKRKSPLNDGCKNVPNLDSRTAQGRKLTFRHLAVKAVSPYSDSSPGWSAWILSNGVFQQTGWTHIAEESKPSHLVAQVDPEKHRRSLALCRKARQLLRFPRLPRDWQR